MKKRIGLISDLHCNFKDLHPEKENLDVLVVAGDLSNSHTETIKCLNTFKVPVVFAPGNHDYYACKATGLTMGQVDNYYLKNTNPNVTVLISGEYTTVGGVEFYGGTGWADYSVCSNTVLQEVKRTLNDFRRINQNEEIYTTRNQKFLSKATKRADVVVSHHIPHPALIREKWKDFASNIAFAFDGTKVFDAVKPQLWMHGHTHDRYREEFKGAHVMCNPKGYQGEIEEEYTIMIGEIEV